MKNVYLFVAAIILLIPFFTVDTYAQSKNYGVFVGLCPENISKLYAYKEVVIDASYYKKEQIDLLHKKGIKVYSYLNIGSIEEFRPYYEDFKHIALGDYENWPDEKWVDVSSSEWQDYITGIVAKTLHEKGVDGFFIDNADVYCKYEDDKIFNGIMDILSKLKVNYGKQIILNGGYKFVKKVMSCKTPINSFIDGVNHESVFTTIDFKNGTFKTRLKRESDYVLNYLNTLKSNRINIYVVEYTKDKKLANKIAAYYNNLGFKYYIAENIALD